MIGDGIFSLIHTWHHFFETVSNKAASQARKGFCKKKKTWQRTHAQEDNFMEEPEEEEGGSAEPAPLSVVPSTGKAHTAPRRHPPSHILELGADGPHVVAPRRGVSSWRVHHNEHGDWVLSSWDSQGNMLQECLLPQAASESWTLMNGHDPGSAHIWSEGSAAPMHCATFMANHASSASAQCSAPPKPPPAKKMKKTPEPPRLSGVPKHAKHLPGMKSSSKFSGKAPSKVAVSVANPSKAKAKTASPPIQGSFGRSNMFKLAWYWWGPICSIYRISCV